MSKEKRDLYAEITDKVIAALKAGVQPWLRPWSVKSGGNSFVNVALPIRSNSQHYQGINVLLLWWEAMDKGYTNPMWMTYKQAAALKAVVRKGEKGTLVVYAAKFKKEIENTKGEKETKFIPFLKSYYVFNIEQIDGLPKHYYGVDSNAQPAVADSPAEIQKKRLEHIEAYFANCKVDIRHGGNSAFYSPKTDHIQIPEFATFRTVEAYYATLGHELIHWTGAVKRLNRDVGKRFGDKAYAAEELVAELGAAFLCAVLGLVPEIREDHAPYIKHWIDVLGSDKRFIFTAASAAQKAVGYLQKLNGIEDVPAKTEEDIKAAA